MQVIYESIFNLWELIFPANIVEQFSNLFVVVTVFAVISLILATIVLPFIKLFKYIFGGF